MKKFLALVVSVLMCVCLAAGVTACGKSDPAVAVYMPDGAPALAVAQLMAEDNQFETEVEYTVVDSTTITTYVTGENPKADICILPVNSASKLLGTGAVYKMLGTVTHGNLFMLKKAGGEDITADNLENLVGKTVGVINLAAIPGLTIKLILNDNDISYNVVGNDGAVAEDKVNLKAVEAEEVLPTNSDCDYFIVPEPAATTKVSATGGKLAFASDLQELYGSYNGYPQAVLVAKNSLIESQPEFIEEFMTAIADNASWLLSESTAAETVVNAVQAHLTEGLSPTFSAQNLSKDVIANCAINFVKSAYCKEEVNAILKKIIAVDASMAEEVAESFYYVK